MTQILNRWNGDVIAEGDMSLRELVLHVVEVAQKEGTRADLTDANLTDANLTRADLTCADLTDANLTRADLTDANLTDANLTRADLTDANLTDANLTRADLTDANLTCADLTDADLTCADLDYCAWPLRCSSLNVKVCNKIAAQLLFHSFAVSALIPTAEQVEFMRRSFHRLMSAAEKKPLPGRRCHDPRNKTLHILRGQFPRPDGWTNSRWKRRRTCGPKCATAAITRAARATKSNVSKANKARKGEKRKTSHEKQQSVTKSKMDRWKPTNSETHKKQLMIDAEQVKINIAIDSKYNTPCQTKIYKRGTAEFKRVAELYERRDSR
jgi:hypothetical protein